MDRLKKQRRQLVIKTDRERSFKEAYTEHWQAVRDVRALFLKLEGERIVDGGAPYEPDRLGFNVLG